MLFLVSALSLTTGSDYDETVAIRNRQYMQASQCGELVKGWKCG